MFHTQCLLMWMRTNSNCPVCKSSINAEDEVKKPNGLFVAKEGTNDELERLYEMKAHYEATAETNESLPKPCEYQPYNARKVRQSETLIPENATKEDINQLIEEPVMEAAKRRALKNRGKKYKGNSM